MFFITYIKEEITMSKRTNDVIHMSTKGYKETLEARRSRILSYEENGLHYSRVIKNKNSDKYQCRRKGRQRLED